MNIFKRTLCITVFNSIIFLSVYGQDKSRFDFSRIEDNSFLLEEAYNQEPGVIQHIQNIQLGKDKSWAYTFTQEWPVPDERHQLSYVIPVQYLIGVPKNLTGIGDIILNYRYQLLSKERIAIAPRLSLIAPTGNENEQMGNGKWGFQFNLPVSYLISTKFVTHWNLGATFTNNIKLPDGINTFDKHILTYGASLIYLASGNFNLMIETLGTTTFNKMPSKTNKENSFIINPGLRYAFNFKSGLQIVPGFAVPMDLVTKGDYSIFFYLSFEHPAWHPKEKLK